MIDEISEHQARVVDSLTDGNQFLTFTLHQEEYGIEILKVQEIKGFSRLTPIPNAPHYVKGVLNLRGTVVPIIDLRSRFSMQGDCTINHFPISTSSR